MSDFGTLNSGKSGTSKSRKGCYPKSANWRIIIPNLYQYKDASLEELKELKYLILERLKHRPQLRTSRIKSQFDRGLLYYHIALELHSNGVPHLDILLIYQKSIQRQLVDYDYLLKHGNITTYRKLNLAIIDYGKKEDKDAVSNIPKDKSVFSILEVQNLRENPYRYLELQMLKDPLNFNLQQYVRKNDFNQYLTSWFSLKTRLKDSQQGAATLSIKKKPGIKFIDRAHIQSMLSPSQLKSFDAWVGYQTIVNKLNQMVYYNQNRLFKSKQLLLVGLPNTGKTSLVRQLQKYVAAYHLDVSTWFPRYQNNTYSLMVWDQFKLKGSMSHTDLLKFLQGSPMDLQFKGGSTLRNQNQLLIMTSNMSLQDHIKIKFKDSDQRDLARLNLSVRIEQVIIPEGLSLFLLLKLITSAS